MQALVGGNVLYPNLQEVADLFRVSINDTANNTGGSGVGSGLTAGVIMPNSNPDLGVFMRSAIRTLYSDMRNMGDPELLLDNYILLGLPPINGIEGPGSPDPAKQVAIAYSGYFDGVQWYSAYPLPVSCRRVLALWERETGSNDSFIPMDMAPFGLPGILQGVRQRHWEMRQNQVWMPGAIIQTDIRIRCTIGFPSSFNVSTVNYSTTYIPLLNCADALAAKMKVAYAMRFAPGMLQEARNEEQLQMAKLYLETVRQKQGDENEREEWGAAAVQDFAISWSWL